MGWNIAGPFAGRHRNCRIGGVGYLAREAQQQARKARQREAKQVVGDARDGFHAPTIATVVEAGN